MQQQEQQEGLSTYWQTLRGSEVGGQESLLLGEQNQVSQLAAMQARLRGVPSTLDESLRMAQITDQTRRADPPGLQAFTQQRRHQAAPLLSQLSDHQASLSPHQQLLLNTTLEREQINAQIQVLREQMQRRQGEHPPGSNPAKERSGVGKK